MTEQWYFMTLIQPPIRGCGGQGGCEGQMTISQINKRRINQMSDKVNISEETSFPGIGVMQYER